MIRNIVFDMGNVILRFDPAYFIRREGITAPEDTRVLMNEIFRSAEWALMDLGEMDEESAEPVLRKRIPERLWQAAHRLLFNWADAGETIPGMTELAEKLKESGYPLYLLSNASFAQHEYWARVPVSRLFSGTLISCDYHVVKPSREIYRIFTDRFALKPEECLFIDDSHVNIAGAVREGWEGIVFHGDAHELECRMREKGINI